MTVIPQQAPCSQNCHGLDHANIFIELYHLDYRAKIALHILQNLSHLRPSTALLISDPRRSNSQQLVKERRSKPSNRVPASRSVPPRAGRREATTGALATAGVPSRDVEERRRVVVQPGVEEAERRAALGLAGGVEQGDDTSKRGRRRGRAGQQGAAALVVDDERLALRRDVRDAAAAGVEQARVRAADGAQVRGDGVGLPRGLGVVDAEAAGREGHAALRGRARRRAHGRHVRAAGGEGRQEGGGRVVGVGLARAARPGVAAAEQDGHAARAELHEQVAHLQGVLFRHGLLFLAVGGGERLGQGGVVLGQDVGEEFQVGLVCAGVPVVEGRDERSSAACAVLQDWNRLAHSQDVLQVQVCLA